MKIQGKVATWLEMVATPHLHDEAVELKMHPVDRVQGIDPNVDCQCYAVSLNGRWLCSNNGSLTIFQGRDAVQRFMRLARQASLKDGEPMAMEVDCRKNAHCMVIGRDKTLRACEQASQLPS